MSLPTIPLDQLKFGHEASPPINARKVGRDEEVESLAASIIAHGLGQALSVRVMDGVAYVADGNRRLAALQLNAKMGKLPADWPVKVDDSATGDAGELSLALNIERVPMHEADQYEKFVELQASGLSPEMISARFGIEPVRVRRKLALGALSPVVLDAWRNDEFGNHTNEVVKAFTMAASPAEQERIYHKLKEADRLYGHQIRAELGGGDRQAAVYVKFVGMEAYQAAGGVITEDLFGENHIVSDGALAKRLAEEKILAKRQELLDGGWAWVEFHDDLPYNWSYTWNKLQLNKTSATPEQKATSGCVVRFTHNGDLEITYGVIKPKPAKAAKATADGPPAPALISNAVMQRLSVQLTKAARQAVTANPKTALAAVIAGLIGRMEYGGVPVRVHAEGLLKESRDKPDFTELFSALMEKPVEDLLSALAAETGFMVDMSSHNNLAPPLGKAVNRQFCEALEVEPFQQALRDQFDAEDYFRSVPKSFTLTAICDAVGDDQARKCESMKKGDIVTFALANVPATGWLPPELRTAHYAGPVARPAPTAATKPRKPTKKKPATEDA